MSNYKVVDADQLDADLTVVADAIREKGGTSEPLAFPSGMADAVKGIQSGGGVNWLDYGSSFQYLFQNAVFLEETVDIKFGSKQEKFTTASAFIGTFYSVKGCKRLKIDTDLEPFNDNLNLDSMFRFNIKDEFSEIEVLEMPFLKKIQPTSFNRTFQMLSSLREIVTAIDATKATTFQTCFTGCSSLKEIRFVENTIKLTISFIDSSLLSNESIQSIIGGLADLTGQTAQTLTLHADVKVKLTDEQIATITSKNWTLA